MMFVHSPLSNTKTTPNVRKRRSRKRLSEKSESHSQESLQIFSPTNGTTKTYAVKKNTKKTKAKWPKIKPWKIIVGTIVIGLGGLLYLNHVFQTQQLLQQVNQLKNQYDKVSRVYSDTKYTYDRMIGPAEVYSKASKLGLVSGNPANQVIIINNH